MDTSLANVVIQVHQASPKKMAMLARLVLNLLLDGHDVVGAKAMAQKNSKSINIYIHDHGKTAKTSVRKIVDGYAASGLVPLIAVRQGKNGWDDYSLLFSSYENVDPEQLTKFEEVRRTLRKRVRRPS